MKVGFLKTHKCASSAVQNILIRWGMARDLNFVLPLSGNYLLGEEEGEREVEGKEEGKEERVREGVDDGERSIKRLKFNRSSLSSTPWERRGLDYHVFCLHTGRPRSVV